jgi:hypothetical protein
MGTSPSQFQNYINLLEQCLFLVASGRPQRRLQEFSPFIEAKHKVKMMSYSHFTQICKRLHGYKMSDWTGDDDADDVWLQQKNQLHQLETFEKAMFEPSIEIFLN